MLGAIGVAFVGVLRALWELLLFLTWVALQALQVALLIAPGLLRLAAIGAVIAVAVITWPKIYLAYGGSLDAALPASCIILAPLAFALVVGVESSLWGALVFASLTTWGAGVVIPLLPGIVRGLLVVGVLGAIVLHFISRKEINEDEPQVG